MTRSYAIPAGRSPRTRRTQPISTSRPRTPGDPSITRIGFACFTLVRVFGDPDAPSFVVRPNPRTRNAMAAFARNLPLRLDAPGRFWRRLSWGRTVDFFVLDARSERNRAAGEYISRAQADSTSTNGIGWTMIQAR